MKLIEEEEVAQQAYGHACEIKQAYISWWKSQNMDEWERRRERAPNSVKKENEVWVG